MRMLIIAALVVPMLSRERAEWNARRLLELMGWWVPARCIEADDASFVCAAHQGERTVIMRCSGAVRDTCTCAVYGR